MYDFKVEEVQYVEKYQFNEKLLIFELSVEFQCYLLFHITFFIKLILFQLSISKSNISLTDENKTFLFCSYLKILFENEIFLF